MKRAVYPGSLLADEPRRRVVAGTGYMGRLCTMAHSELQLL